MKKRIAMFSMTPLFPGQSMGGAQKQLRKIAVGLGEQGHEVTILCTRRSDAMHPFDWHERVRIHPVYRFKQPFPEPYATDVYHIAAAIQDTAQYLAQADVFYSHDGGLIFPYIYQGIPAVISLRSILFSETLQAGFLFQGHRLIVPSQHTAECWIATVGRFFPEFAQRVQVIPNGLDFDVYRPVDDAALAQRIGVDPSRNPCILYPHRPEDAKGIRQTIAVVDELVHRHGLKDVRVLVPRWVDYDLAPHVAEYYAGLKADINSRGLSEHFIFHDWIGDDDMPGYYSLGVVTFALGSYVETFGNTPYESLACGTPVVAAAVGPYRDMLPALGIEPVAYGDVVQAAEQAAFIIQQRQRTSPQTLKALQEGYGLSAMIEAYTDTIIHAQPPQPMAYQPQLINAQTRWQLAPWCAVLTAGVYHDFRGDYFDDAELAEVSRQDFITTQEVEPARLETWYRAGFIVPVIS